MRPAYRSPPSSSMSARLRLTVRRFEEECRWYRIQLGRREPRFEVVGQRSSFFFVERLEAAEQPLLNRFGRVRQDTFAGGRQAEYRTSAIDRARRTTDQAISNQARNDLGDG